MRKWHGIALLIAVSGLLAACGGGGHTATSTTTSATPATTALAPGETQKLAQIVRQAPPGYRYIDPPASLTGDIQAEYTRDPNLSKVVKGLSAHSILRESDNSTIGLLFLLQLDPVFATQPSAEDSILKSIGATAAGIQQVELGGRAWSKGTIKFDSSSLVYACVQDDVLFAVAGDDPSAIESYITAAKLTA